MATWAACPWLACTAYSRLCLSALCATAAFGFSQHKNKHALRN